MKRLPELLAPAGSPEALRAAVAAGADAVYIGGRLFGARMLARNFNDRELEEAIDYAHLHGVKAYVTVNTLVRDEELERVGEYLIRLYGMGADAILVQDLGVAALARRVVPELGLHASTQMTIHSREGVAFAARMGFGRVVLARELSLGEVEGMADVGIGLEAFVHGALCYSYSGQCLLSSAIGGRSGNRGMCAQPCRKPYLLMRGGKDEFGRPKNLQAVHLRDRFLLSTRDLSVYRSLDRIVGCPLASIKIEGRMKSAEYVAIVTSIYRRALDAIAKGAWRPSPEDERDLALAFNRGFTEGYILGARDVMGREMPDNRGLLIGSVISYDSKRREASVRLAGSLVPEEGDGLVIRGPGQEMGLVVSGARLKGGIFRLRTDGGVRPGARVYLTGSRALARRAQEIVSSQPRRIPIDIILRWDDRTPIAEARLEGGICVQVRGMRMEEATSQPLSSDQIEAQIKRTGGTPFVVRGIKIDYPGGLFSPLSALNMLRRDLLAAAREAMLAASRPSSEGVASARERLKEADLQPSATSSPRAPALSAYVDSLEQAHEAVEGGCSRIYLEVPIGECALDLLQEARGICHVAEIVWKWPRITRKSYIDQAGQMLHRADVDGVMVEGVDGLQAVRERMPRMRVYGGAGLNVWNHLTVQQLLDLHLLTLSPELSKGQLGLTVARSRLMPYTPLFELVAQGSLEVMVSEGSLPFPGEPGPAFWGIHDSRRLFPLRLDSEGRTHIYNSVETCLLDHIPSLFQIGLDSLALDCRGRTGRYAREISEIYRRAISITSEGGSGLARELETLKERARAMALGGITSGHFLKGLRDLVA